MPMEMEMGDTHNSPDFGGKPSIKGTPDKCDFCPHTIKNGELPHCVTACPNGVFYFGDKYEDTVTNEEVTVRLSKLLEDKAAYKELEELGTALTEYYLHPVDGSVDFNEGVQTYTKSNYSDKP